MVDGIKKKEFKAVNNYLRRFLEDSIDFKFTTLKRMIFYNNFEFYIYSN